ncbi:hypothetical protein ACFX19_010624 [Malus domestica]
MQMQRHIHILVLVFVLVFVFVFVFVKQGIVRRHAYPREVQVLQPRVCGRDEETRVLFPSSGHFCWEISTSTRTGLGFSSRRKLKSENFVGVTATAALSDTKRLNVG